MIIRRCPTCNAVRLEGLFTLCVPCGVLTWPGRRVTLGPVTARVLERLALARRGYVNTGELIAHVYGDCEDGGPLTANKSIHSAVSSIRAKLIGRSAPFRIENAPRHGYCLVPVAGGITLTNAPHNVHHVGKARLSAGVIPIGRERGETLAPALFSGAA